MINLPLTLCIGVSIALIWWAWYCTRVRRSERRRAIVLGLSLLGVATVFVIGAVVFLATLMVQQRPT